MASKKPPELSTVATKLYKEFCSHGYRDARFCGLLSDTMVEELIKSLAFTLLSAQDESVDLRKVLKDLELAVPELTKYIVSRPLVHEE